jgi:site-specific DNA-methyltransferase (adenine-specific)
MPIEINRFYIANAVDFIKSDIPDNFVDLTVTSPPYDTLRKYNGYEFDFESLANELYRVTKQGGVVVWVVGDKTEKGSESGTSFRQALYFKEIGFNLHDTMIYQKCGLPKNHNRYEQEFEYMFVLSKGKPKTFKPIFIDNIQAGRPPSRGTFRQKGDKTEPQHTSQPVKEQRIKGNVWNIDVGYMRTTKYKNAYKHPAIFPEALAQDHILTWSNEGDLVLDPMCGSGTTCKMAKLNNRNFIGIDISEDYINDICIPRVC